MPGDCCFLVYCVILNSHNGYSNVGSNQKKVTIDRIVTYLNNASASNWDKESVEANLKEIQTKGIINENYKLLITLLSDFPIFPEYRMMFVLHLK